MALLIIPIPYPLDPYTRYASEATFGGYDYTPEAVDARCDELMKDKDDIYDGVGYLASVNYTTLALPKDFYKAYASLVSLKDIIVEGQKVHNYGDAIWYHVEDDIFDLDNWSVIK